MKIYTISDFFWKTQTRDNKEKLEKICRILNSLTPEQIEAVQFYCNDNQIETEWEQNAD